MNNQAKKEREERKQHYTSLEESANEILENCDRFWYTIVTSQQKSICKILLPHRREAKIETEEFTAVELEIIVTSRFLQKVKTKGKYVSVKFDSSKRIDQKRTTFMKLSA